MEKYIIKDGVVCGQENNQDLFIRKVSFKVGHVEETFHYHKNSFEFYVVLAGSLVFESSENNEPIIATKDDIIYFKDSEKHRITKVIEDAGLLLIKKIESEKITL